MPRDLLHLGNSAVLAKAEEPQDGAVVLTANVPPRAVTETAQLRRRPRSRFDQRAAASKRIQGAKSLNGSARFTIPQGHFDVPGADLICSRADSPFTGSIPYFGVLPP